MDDGRMRPGHPEDSSLRRTKQRYSLPKDLNMRRRNMKQAIAGVLVLLDMFLTPAAAVAGLHALTWSGCFPLRSSGTFAHARCVMTRVTAGVEGGCLVLWLGFQKSGKEKKKCAR